MKQRFLIKYVRLVYIDLAVTNVINFPEKQVRFLNELQTDR